MAFEEPSAKGAAKLEKAETRSSSGDFNIKGFLNYLWRKKFWILLSLILFTGYSYYQYKQKPHIYKSEAQVMFLFGNETSSAGISMPSLGDLAGKLNVNMNNELEMIKSPALMEDVVAKLGLEVSYSTPRMGYMENMYGYSPVDVFFYEVPSDSSASFIIKRMDDRHVLAYDFVLNGKPMGGPGLRIEVNTVVETPVGQIALIPTDHFANFPSEVIVSKRTAYGVASSLSGKVTTGLKSEGNTVVTLGFEDTNQQLATDILSTLIVSYNELWTEENQRSANQTSKFIRERLVSLESELSGIDKSIAGKQKAAGGTSLTDSYTPKGEERIDQAYDLTTNLAIAENARSRVVSALNSGMPVIVSTGNSGLDALTKEYNEALEKGKELSKGAGENSPYLKENNDRIEQLRQGITSGLNSMIADYRLQASRVQSLGSTYKSRGSVIPDVQAEMLPVERQQKVKENLYLYLLQKREENELNKMIASNNTRIIQPAHAIGVVGPYIMQSMSSGIIVGLCLPLVVLFLLFKFDTRVKSRGDLKGLTAPFLGEMPISEYGRKKSRISIFNTIRKKNRKEDDANIDIVVKERSRSYINEAFRIVRTNLDFMGSGTDGSQVILVTSYEPGSGKTFISLNLGVSLALKNKKVLIIDVDLRCASLSKFEGNMAQGLSACLTGKVSDPLALVVKDKKRGLVDILTVGAIPPNPVELLLSERFAKLISDMKMTYDYILLDCPPYDLVADTAIIAGVADTSIFVIRAGLFQKMAVPDVEDLYKSGKLPRMTVLLNGVDPQKTYYNHRYGYKTDHGYYIKEEDEDRNGDSVK